VKAPNAITNIPVCVCVCVCVQELLRTIEERRDTYQVVMNIGDIFIRVVRLIFFFFFLHLTVLTRCPPTQSDYFKMYNMYCSNHPYAVNKMETIKSKAFLKFINVHDHSVCSHVVSPFCATGATQQARVPQPRLGIVLDQTCPAYLQVPSSVARMLNCRLQLEK